MNRRNLLKRVAAVPLIPVLSSPSSGLAAPAGAMPASLRRNRPSDPGWPSAASWEKLNREVGGHLIKVQSPLIACASAAGSESCNALFDNLKNPYYINSQPALTQTTGWVDGWSCAPSAYAVAARSAREVVAAVNFARENNLRLVVKGGGHSYQGTSNAADSLLIWTREMNGITLHDEFVEAGCVRKAAPQAAVTVESGAIWMHTYDAVVTKAGRYVQGGGCATVGVAGLIQSGGFGSFSKNYGMAAAGLLEAEIVTADGIVRTANACTNPDLFWAIKGGGGSLGVITKLTLRTRELPEFFGGVLVSIKAGSDAAFRRLIGRFVGFYGDALFNPHWGETASFRPGNLLEIFMVFQGLDKQQADAVWQPFLDWVAEAPQDFTIPPAPRIVTVPARKFWDPEYLRRNLPDTVLADSRPGAPQGNVFWAGNLGETGQFLYGYESVWLPASLLKKDRQMRLADALFAGSRRWPITLHFNKGLAGAPGEAVDAAKDTAMNPAVLDAFALAISASSGPPAYPGIPGHEPDLRLAREHAGEIAKAMDELRKLTPNPGSYVSEGNFFDSAWQRSYWGPNYPRLSAVKQKYDPAGLFIVHHGVGSEEWSADGFTRLASR
jgi:FAD/FMN-containing dehydrogenase